MHEYVHEYVHEYASIQVFGDGGESEYEVCRVAWGQSARTRCTSAVLVVEISISRIDYYVLVTCRGSCTRITLLNVTFNFQKPLFGAYHLQWLAAIL